jgi:type IV pilus assembly protein PilB
VRSGLIGEEDLRSAQREQQRTRKSLSQVLLEQEKVSESDLARTLAEHHDLDYVELNELQVDTVAASLVPEQLARRYGVLPIAFDDSDSLQVAMSEPGNVLAVDDLRTITDCTIKPVVAAASDIAAAIDRYVRMGDSVDDLAEGLDAEEEQGEDLAGLQEVVDDAPIVKFVNALISQAVKARASDIHIEPTDKNVRVRYRIDGVLQDASTQSRKAHPGMVSRLKIMADLDIAEHRLPQDGRISLKTAGRNIDLRLSTLPTVQGEKVVMRILDKSSVLLELSDLGFLDDSYARYEESFTKPYGMILVTGPTGSGKSTTLYATLNIISKPEVNCVTVEDPVEYRIPGINQVQAHPKAGLTFPAALRSILRQDPDVVLVGEMRDQETAQIGMEAALTGHVVLSTLHTNDAPSAVTRLTEMGVEPFLVANSLDCVLAQRLARRLCSRCKEPYEPSESELIAGGMPTEHLEELPTLYRAVGCGRCVNSGYRGRLALHEVMQVTEEIERLVVEGAATDEINKYAQAQGMRPLREDGLAKVRQGLTTLDELNRVVV